MSKKLLALFLSLVLVFSLVGTTVASGVDETLPFENSEYFDYGDYTLHYRVYEPDGEVVNQIMLIHGFCLSTVSFEDLAELYVSEGYRVVLVDMPNFGYCSRETTSTDLLDREFLVYQLMLELSSDKWIVGGHSMGGGIALNVATDYPEMISGLVLVSPQTSNEASSFLSTIMTSWLVTSIMDIMVKFALAMPFVVDMLVEMSFSDSDYADDYDDSRITDPFEIEGTGAGLAIMTSHTRGTDFDLCSEIDVPVVIITSSNDQIAMASNTAEILASMPNAVTFEVDYGGHMIMEYDSEYTAQLTLPTMQTMTFEAIDA